MRTPDPEPDEIDVALPPALLDRLDDACIDQGYGTRSAFVTAAIDEAFGDGE